MKKLKFKEHLKALSLFCNVGIAETYFKEIRSRESLANKKDKDVVTFACSKNLLTDEYALYLKLLAKMSYRIKFAQIE